STPGATPRSRSPARASRAIPTGTGCAPTRCGGTWRPPPSWSGRTGRWSPASCSSTSPCGSTASCGSRASTGAPRRTTPAPSRSTPSKGCGTRRSAPARSTPACSPRCCTAVMLPSMMHRGDVKGLFVGHDHVNTYAGDYYGIQLGYAPSTGFGTYGLGGAEEHHLRGARVFRLDESVKGVCTGTERRFAADYGIDLSEGVQPGEPADFPDGVG